VTALLRAAVAAAVVSVLLAVSGPATAGPADPLTVHIGPGDLRGVRAGAAEQFLGVPYAAPPVGDLRWRPPRPPARWSGTRSAAHHGNACPQVVSVLNPRSETEDCLVLDVYLPAGTRQGARVPVFVWIHGGNLLYGSGAPYDGSQLAAETGVVVVSINYRLGVFGFLGHPALTAAAGESGNYGLADQQAALRWVHRNIAAFGGDPRAVTIGGESAGGWSVCAHLAAPGSRGLFARAISQSGGCPSNTEAETEAAGTAVATRVGCTDAATAAACLRATPAGRLVDSSPIAPIFVTRGTPTLPRDPRVAVATGRFTRVPVVIGDTRDEGRTLTVGNIGWARARYRAWVYDTTGPAAGAVLARYPWPAGADRFTPAYLTGAVTTDAGLDLDLGGCPARRLAHDLARRTPTYRYQFDHRTGPGPFAGPPGYVWGAGHAAELQYLWPGFRDSIPADRPLNGAELGLARQLRAYWGAFVRTGHPAARAQPTWTRDGVLSFRAGPRSRMVPDRVLAAQHRCDFWDPAPTAVKPRPASAR
jgi:para-nitrobenzyl esterase